VACFPPTRTTSTLTSEAPLEGGAELPLRRARSEDARDGLDREGDEVTGAPPP
jgi:hypothetical protein